MYYPRGYEMLTNGNQTTVWRPMKSRENRCFLALTITRCLIKSDIVASLIIEHTVNFALLGNNHGPCNLCVYLATGHGESFSIWQSYLPLKEYPLPLKGSKEPR